MKKKCFSVQRMEHGEVGGSRGSLPPRLSWFVWKGDARLQEDGKAWESMQFRHSKAMIIRARSVS